MPDTNAGMPRAPSENTAQIVVRVPEEWVKRTDALIPWITRPGIAATRTDVFRAAMALGLDALEAQRRGEKTTAKKSAK